MPVSPYDVFTVHQEPRKAEADAALAAPDANTSDRGSSESAVRGRVGNPSRADPTSSETHISPASTAQGENAHSQEEPPNAEAGGDGSESSAPCSVCQVCPRRTDSSGSVTLPTRGFTCEAKLNESSQSDKPGARGKGAPRNVLTDEACLMCWKAPVQPKIDFCSTACSNDAARKAPLLLEVPRGHAIFHAVTGHFKATWRAQSPCPQISTIYKIVETNAVIQKFEEYKYSRNAVASSTSLEPLRWHSARRDCRLGDPGIVDLCRSEKCRLCSVVNTSFNVPRMKQGISTSRESSSSDRFSNRSGRLSKKTVLFTEVTAGRNIELSPQEIPKGASGYDSVRVFDYSLGMKFDCDELIVFTPDAIKLLYLVVYG